MSEYNRFGVIAANITDLFPNVSAADMGGTTVIEAAIDRAVRRIASLMPSNVHELLNNRVVKEQIVGNAFGGEGATFTLGLSPVADASKILIYRMAGDNGKPPECAPGMAANQEGNLSGATNTTLTLTGASTTLNEGEYLYATYVVDTTDASFALPSYGDYVVYATAYELGSKLFDQETDSWSLVDEYKEMAAAYLEELKSGGFVDSSIRALEFCEEIEPAEASVQSIKRYRA